MFLRSGPEHRSPAMLCRQAGSFAFGKRPVSLALHGARATPLPGRRWLRSSKTTHRTLARGTPTPKMSRALAARHRASKAVTLPACLKTGGGRNMPASAGREVGHLRTCFCFRFAPLLLCFNWLLWTEPAIVRTVFNILAGHVPAWTQSRNDHATRTVVVS